MAASRMFLMGVRAVARKSPSRRGIGLDWLEARPSRDAACPSVAEPLCFHSILRAIAEHRWSRRVLLMSCSTRDALTARSGSIPVVFAAPGREGCDIALRADCAQKDSPCRVALDLLRHRPEYPRRAALRALIADSIHALHRKI